MCVLAGKYSRLDRKLLLQLYIYNTNNIATVARIISYFAYLRINFLKSKIFGGGAAAVAGIADDEDDDEFLLGETPLTTTDAVSDGTRAGTGVDDVTGAGTTEGCACSTSDGWGADFSVGVCAGLEFNDWSHDVTAGAGDRRAFFALISLLLLLLLLAATWTAGSVLVTLRF